MGKIKTAMPWRKLISAEMLSSWRSAEDQKNQQHNATHMSRQVARAELRRRSYAEVAEVFNLPRRNRRLIARARAKAAWGKREAAK